MSGSFVRTGVPQKLWQSIINIGNNNNNNNNNQNNSNQNTPFHSPISIFFISFYILISSQFVGNVAVVIILSEDILRLDERTQVFAWIIIAWVSTGKYYKIDECVLSYQLFRIS